MAGNRNEEMVYCSFCGKNQEEVKKIIAGNGVFICNECVALSQEIIREETAEEVLADLAETPKPSINSLRVLQLSSSSQLSIRRITPGVSQTAVRFLLSCSSMFFTSAFCLRHSGTRWRSKCLSEPDHPKRPESPIPTT